MKFELCAGFTRINNYLEKYPAFKNYDFELVKDNENSLFDKCFITINSLEELIKLSNSIGHYVVVGSIEDEKIISVCDGYCDS